MARVTIRRFRVSRLGGWCQGLLAILLALIATGTAAGADVIVGADFSHLAFFESRGVVYRDAGQPGDALVIAKRHGVNCVRLRLFTSSAAQSQADPYNYINNLDYTLTLAVRVKKAGLRFLLDFHYSDTWADPGHQRKPDAWTNLTFAQLVQQMRAYNSNTIAALGAAGAMPDYVQIGNEITSGMLWPDGRVGGSYDTPAQWVQLGQLMTAAIQGIRDASGTNSVAIMVHIDRGGDWNATQWFFDNLRQQQVPFDIIAQSYYPFWHGPIANLTTCLTNAAERYQKPVLIAETAFPWTNSVWNSPIVGIAPGVDGQVQYTALLGSVTGRLSAGLGSGIIWWGAEYQSLAGMNEAGFNTASFFDGQGNLLPVADALIQLSRPIRLSASRADSLLLLNWPLSAAGACLQLSTNLSTAAAWQTLTNLPRLSSTGFSLALPIPPGPCRFYQLRSD